MTTKIHALADAHGNPLRMILTPGQDGDCPMAPTMIAGIRGGALLADKAYDSDALRATLANQGMTAVIPPKANRIAPPPFDHEVYRARGAIENLFCRLKRFRGFATRYDKLDRSYAAMVAIACSVTWARLL